MNHSVLFEDACRFIPGGVNSPVRAFNVAGGTPLFIRRASGKHLYTEDGRVFLDFCLSWGPLILGHAHPAVVKAIQETVKNGISFGLPSMYETRLARLIVEAFASIDKVRFVNSGTEAVMSAIRLARGYTGRDMILKFDGCYHGHSDCLLVNAGSGVARLTASSSAGVPASIVSNTFSIPYNDIPALKNIIQKHAGSLAAVIVEPVPGNMGVILPDKEFLPALRALTAQHGILLIFDEVITGFRLVWGGAQHVYDVTPDITVLGKIIGGGLPIGAFGGREDIMNCIAPEGNVYQAGTLSGNPAAMAAGYATLSYLKCHRDMYSIMERCISAFSDEWRSLSPLTINHIGSMFTIFYTTEPVACYQDARRQDVNMFRTLYQRYLDRGVFLPPSMFESAFISTEHTGDDLRKLLFDDTLLK